MKISNNDLILWNTTWLFKSQLHFNFPTYVLSQKEKEWEFNILTLLSKPYI